MINIAITAADFANSGKAWVEAFGSVANSAIAQFGILGAALLGVWQNLNLSKVIKNNKAELDKRLDSQSLKIHEVALAQSPTNGTTASTTTTPEHTPDKPQPNS